MKEAVGYNIIGFLNGALGLGKTARALLGAARAAGIPVEGYDFPNGLPSTGEHAFPSIADTPPRYATNILCLNPDQLPKFARLHGQGVLEGRRSIGVWFCETANAPAAVAEAASLVDEVWVASAFCREAFAAAVAKPVRVFPHPVEKPVSDRGTLRFDRRFVFLSRFDFTSDVERKNPLGTIDAFRAAFPNDSGPFLVLKSAHGPRFPLDLLAVRERLRGRDDIQLIDGYLGDAENDALTAKADCYLSLHRAEGLGLNLMEAMAAGKPVIATDFSGSRTFLDAGVGFPCGFAPVSVSAASTLYPRGEIWAEPDHADAVRLLRRVYRDQEHAAEIGQRAALLMAREFSPEACGRFLLEALKEERPPGFRRLRDTPHREWRARFDALQAASPRKLREPLGAFFKETRAFAANREARLERELRVLTARLERLGGIVAELAARPQSEPAARDCHFAAAPYSLPS